VVMVVVMVGGTAEVVMVVVITTIITTTTVINGPLFHARHLALPLLPWQRGLSATYASEMCLTFQ
jgi:hypothetical protein